MINYVNFNLFYKNSVDKQTTITYSGGTLTNTDLYLQGMTLIESVNTSQQIQFGSVGAAELRLKISSERLTLSSLVGEELGVSMVIGGDTAHPLTIGTYKVVSDTPDRSGYYREIVAYDALSEVLGTDYSAWYNAQTFPMTLKQFRDGFFAQVGITQETVTLPNDGMTITKTIEPTTLSGKDIIFAICEVNGRLGHLNRSGNFRYVELPELHPALYPADDLFPSDTLYPADEVGQGITGALVVKADYESYYADYISKLTIRDDDDSVGATIGSGANEYIIQNNFLLYGKSTADLTSIGTNIYNVIKQVYYQPCNIEVVGNPCLEVGDAFYANCNGTMVRSYILERKLVGTQSLRDTYTARGKNEINNSPNRLQSQIQRLQGSTHELIVDSNTFKSAIYNPNGTSKIEQNANSITAEVTRATNAENGISGTVSSLSLTVDGINAHYISDQGVYNGVTIGSSGIVCMAGTTTVWIAKSGNNANFYASGDGAFEVHMSNIDIDQNGNLSISGQINAASGYIGTAANGLEITSTGLKISNLDALVKGTDASGDYLVLGDSSGNMRTIIGGSPVTIYGYPLITEVKVSSSTVQLAGNYVNLGYYSGGSFNTRLQVTSSDVSITGDLNISRDLDITRNLSITGNITSNVTATGNVSVGGTLTTDSVSDGSLTKNVSWVKLQDVQPGDYVLMGD